MNDEKLLAALRELGDCLSAVDVPQGVIATFPSLSNIQTQLFTTVLEQDPTAASGTADCIMRLEPTDLLLKCLAAARAKDWPRFIVLVQNTPLELSLPEGLEDDKDERALDGCISPKIEHGI